MHRPHRRSVLIDHRIKRPSALGDITPQPANETQIVRRIDENFYVHLLEQTRLGKNQNAFDDYDGLRLDARRRRQTRMRPEIVYRQLNRLACIQFLQVIDQQFVVNRVRVIEICRVAVVERHVFQIAVVKILLNEDDFIGAHRFEDPIRNRRLA